MLVKSSYSTFGHFILGQMTQIISVILKLGLGKHSFSTLRHFIPDQMAHIIFDTDNICNIEAGVG